MSDRLEEDGNRVQAAKPMRLREVIAALALSVALTYGALILKEKSESARAPLPRNSSQNHTPSSGFTLIELSIVLVIIGLIVGGVLVGQNLIDAAAVRAQVSQIEKYQTATNTFYGKYGALPGDMNNAVASQFGFAQRGALGGQGDGNGVLQGNYSGNVQGYYPSLGELAMFWVDLSAVNFIDGTFNTATPTASFAILTGTQLDQYFPQTKLGSGGHVTVGSGGWSGTDNMNYYILSNITTFFAGRTRNLPVMTVAQAYSIDKKIDDGFPQSGNVLAMALGLGTGQWAAGGGTVNPYFGDYDATTAGPITSSTTNPYYSTANGVTLAQTCYNNGNTLLPEQYSLGVNNGAGVNCKLTIAFH